MEDRSGTPDPTPFRTGDQNEHVALILRDPDFSARYVEGLGSTAVASAPAEFADFIKRDFNYKRELIAASGATVE